MSRHLPHFRSAKFTVITIGSALCVIAAASATAATWPSASAARSQVAVQQAAAGLAATISQAALTAGTAHSQAANNAAAARLVAIEVAAARTAAARAQALAAREHADHVAHQEHLTLQAAGQQQAAAKQQATQQATQQVPQQQASQQPTQPPVTVTSGSPQQIAEGMLAQFGWSSGQFSCLDSLWNAESGWNPTAENPSSGAYGIPQALPGSKMASAGPDWQTDPATQIRWGLEYIQATYGSPCGAWSHEEATGWY